jgi:hypothetical protein
MAIAAAQAPAVMASDRALRHGDIDAPSVRRRNMIVTVAPFRLYL